MADFHTGSRDNRHFLLRHASACGTEGQLRPAGVLRPGQHFINDAAPSGYVLARVGKKWVSERTGRERPIWPMYGAEQIGHCHWSVPGAKLVMRRSAPVGGAVLFVRLGQQWVST